MGTVPAALASVALSSAHASSGHRPTTWPCQRRGAAWKNTRRREL